MRLLLLGLMYGCGNTIKVTESSIVNSPHEDTDNDNTEGDTPLDFDGDGSITPNDRTFELTSGIPSGVVPVFTTEGVIGIVGVEGGSKQLGKLADLPSERGYWFEESDF